MLTLLREIRIEEERLIQQPVEELKQLRANEKVLQSIQRLKNVPLSLKEIQKVHFL